MFQKGLMPKIKKLGLLEGVLEFVWVHYGYKVQYTTVIRWWSYQ